MSSIPHSVFKERSNAVKVEDKGGLSGAGMFVSITRRCQQGDRLEKYFLACQRRDPLTGGLRHRKSSDSFHGLLSVFPFVTSLWAHISAAVWNWSESFFFLSCLTDFCQHLRADFASSRRSLTSAAWASERLCLKGGFIVKYTHLGCFTHCHSSIYIIIYVCVSYHQTVQLWSSTFLARISLFEADLGFM